MDSVIRNYLDSLDWRDSEDAHSAVAQMLRHDNMSGLLLNVLACVEDRDIASLAQRSHETATHYKWFIGAADDWRWQAWLHQYKEPRKAVSGYATTPHTHRYWFSSLIVAGGFQNVVYRVHNSELSIATVQELEVGDSYVISPDWVHSLRNILPGTMTILIRGREKYPFSIEYRNGGELVRHHPMRTHLAVLREFLVEKRLENSGQCGMALI